MLNIIIQNLKGHQIEIQTQKTLLDNIHQTGIDWMHSCGKKGRCTTCKGIILKGGDLLSTLSENELRMSNLNRIQKDERLMCQTKVKEEILEGTITVKVPEFYKLPHLQYDEN
jgi:2Fe-2S ferredoxin